MTAPASVTANFAPGVFNITIASVPAALAFTVTGTGCSAGSYNAPQTLAWTYGGNCTVSFPAAQSGGPGINYNFQQWEDASTSASRALAVPAAAATYTATFGTSYNLTKIASPLAAGSVSGCSTSCTSAHSAGSVLNITASPASGYAFSGWSGACSGTGACSVTMDAAKSVTANFVASGTSLSASLSGKAGPAATRTWTINAASTGPGDATGLAITGVSLVHQTGPVCTPTVLTSFPVSLGDITGAGSRTGNVTINFTGCAALSRFKATISVSANGGTTTGSSVISNQFQ